jgi:hypothetical protein
MPMPAFVSSMLTPSYAITSVYSEVGNVTLKCIPFTRHHVCHVLRAIILIGNNVLNLDRAITLRRDNDFYVPRAIMFRNDNLLCCDKVLSNNIKCNVALYSSYNVIC